MRAATQSATLVVSNMDPRACGVANITRAVLQVAWSSQTSYYEEINYQEAKTRDTGPR